MSTGASTRDSAWQEWTFGDFVKETERALAEVDFPANASFSPLALHYYSEGILIELRYRRHVYATAWLSDYPDLASLREWAVRETLRFVDQRKEQKSRLIRMRRGSESQQ